MASCFRDEGTSSVRLKRRSRIGGRRRPRTNRLELGAVPLHGEVLEWRILLDSSPLLPPTIVVGRTLSAYDVPDVQNQQETINFTVYNQQSTPITGVLLTDTLEPGVTFASASVLPDQNGQQLAWSLGTINGYDRTSVQLVVSLASPIPTQLDVGASAYGTLNAGMVNWTTAPATLRTTAIAPNLLASTPDANTTDPFIQEKAAELGYNAQNIFNFVHNDIGYNSYLGSVRGARGTLWSSAGNALDVASLGVALDRASGIPAQYAQGTLSSFNAQTLILSMFPASYQLAGYIPAGTTTADPAHDPQLLSETESHYWFEFDTGTGFQNADPLMSAFVGTTFTTSQGTFTEVPDNLREKTEVSVNAEIYSQANAAFGGTGLTDTTVLDQTFNDVDLVGRPLTFGNFVSSTAQGGLVFLTVTNTYTPYIQLGDDAYPDPSRDEVIEGTPYQELLTNFPLGSQFLTGLFLNIQLSGPQGSSESYERSLVDRIGFAARQTGGTVQIAPVDPTGPPVLSSFDTWNLSILAGSQSAEAAQLLQDTANEEASNSSGPAMLPQLITIARSELAAFSAASDHLAGNIAALSDVLGYFGRPRVTMFSSNVRDDTKQATLVFSVDLIKDDMRALAFPGQNVQAALTFAGARGFIDSILEGQVVPAAPGNQSTTAPAIIVASVEQGIPLVVITASNSTLVQELGLPAEAKARIIASVNEGLTVIVPVQAVTINGSNTTAWLQLNPVTGEMIGVMQNGGHQSALEYAVLGLIVSLNLDVFLPMLGIVPVGPEGAKFLALSNIGVVGGAVALAFTPFPVRVLFLGVGVVLAALGKFDPPLQPLLSNLTIPFPNNPRNQGASSAQISANASDGHVSGGTLDLSVALSHQSTASWTTNSTSSVLITSLSAAGANVLDANGNAVGSGPVVLASSSASSAAVSGNVSYRVDGQGKLSFYGPAESSLGVSGDWDNYTATVTGNVSITISTHALVLNGQTLPAGTYTITTSSATLAGNGATTSPNFSGSASITATGDTVDLGAGTGDVTVGGSTLDATNGVTLTGYTGSISVAAGGGDSTDAVTLNGNADNVLTISGVATALTTDQNTPVTFQTSVKTSFADTYTLTTQAPAGWTVSIDANGNVTATPAAGLQSGTYPIQVVAQSTTDPDLVAQATVKVTIKSTLFGISLNVAPDPLTTVPFNGAQLPTAFVASIHNSGPSPVTENLSFSNIPNGFSLLESATSITIPAGQIGSVGLYLVPTSQIPAPGSQFSFKVSTSDVFGQKASQTVLFTVPDVDAVTVSSGMASVNVAPGATVTDPVTIANVGNVTEDVVLSSSADIGLTLGGLANVTVQPGQSVTENVTFTADPSTTLDTLLGASITATYGPVASPQTTSLQVLADVAVPGASAISAAVAAATRLNEADLVNRLNDLSTELTSLVLGPTSPVAQSQVLGTLTAIIGLLPNDVYLASLVPAFTADHSTLAQAVTSTDIENALTQLGNDLGSIATTLTDEVAHSLTLSLDPNQGQARPQVPVLFPIAIQNTGNQPTTYDFSVSGLPAGVTASFNYASVTLQPGQSLFGGPTGVVLTLTETGGTLAPTGFTVTATAEGAPEINQSAAGSLTIRNAFVQVATVTPSPSFTNPGAKVDIAARILNVTANPMTAQAFYTVSDSGGNVIFTSKSVSVPFSSFVNFPTVDLGSYDTTGLTAGSYTVSVMVTDAAGNPLTSVPGQASVQIGSPVTASLSLTPTTDFPDFPDAQPLTSTLKIDAQTTFPPPLTLEGIVATDAPETSVAVDGTLAFAVGTKDVSIIDVSNPASPQVLSTFGSNVITQGGSNICRITGNLLLIGSQNTINTNFFNFLIYDITNPLSPVLISKTQFNYSFIADMVIQGTTAFIPIGGIATFVNVVLTDQFGDFLAVDFSNPAQPRLSDVLFNNRGAPEGGDFIESAATTVNSQVTYVATTTSKGANSQIGSGELLIVNTSNPSALAVAGSLNIPDTVQLLAIAIEGNTALAIGSTGGQTITSGAASATLAGNLTLTPLDITDPLHPKIIGSTLVTQDQFFTSGQNTGDAKIDAVDLGNSVFAVSGTPLNGKPVILLVNTTNPNQMVVGVIQTPSIVSSMTLAGNLVYAPTQDGLSIYNIGQVVGIPVSVSVTLPTGTAVSYNPTSFNIAPSQIVHNAGFDTVTWVSSLGAGLTDLTLTWTSNLAVNQPSETLPVALGATVNFVSQGTAGTITLPGTVADVSRFAFLFVSPSSQTVQPGGSVTDTVQVQRSSNAPDTYNLSLVGLPASWFTLPASITVPAFSFGSAPLTIHPDPSAPAGTYDLTIIATDGTFTDSYQVSVTVQGQAIPRTVDPNSHGIVAELTPTQASAGLGDSASYVVQLTNTGSADDTFTLSASGLPAGVTATFGQTTVDVPPGASNFRDVVLTLTPQLSTTPKDYSFTVTATSSTISSVTSSASAMLNVLAGGVSVALNPLSGAPGAPFQLTVTNTGQSTDTFNLALGGPAALVSQLATSRVTLGPGNSQVVSITTGAVDFAVPGAFELAAAATSQTNPAVQAAATADLTIPTTTGMTAAFSPATEILPVPGTEDFLLLVNNTGNVEDAYTASIVGTTGSITASLAGLTGAATQAIPIFRLPGLSTGAILLTANLSSVGQGTVTVQVQSLNSGTIIADATATLVVNTQAPAANSQSVTTAEGAPLAITLAGSDPNTPALPLTYIVTASPSHGTLSGTAPNLVYTPNVGYFGADSFIFKANNGYLDSALATVSINVIAPPTANNSSVNIPENMAESISLTAADPNTPAQPLTYVITSGPAHGTLSTINGNSVTYTPSSNYFGPDSFQFKVNNGTSDSNVATVSLDVLQATVSAVSVDWGSRTAALQTASDGVRLLPGGRKTDLPWLNINSVAVTLSQAAPLNPQDVSVIGIIGGNYGPVTVSGSGTNYTVAFAKPISRADRVTITIGNVDIATFMRRLDVLPGDANDDGVVNTTDGVLILNNTTPAHAYQAAYDFNGDGVVSSTDFTLYRPFIGTVLPSLPPQLAAGGEGSGNVPLLTSDELAPVLAEAVYDWAAAGLRETEVARLEHVSAQIVALPAGYLGGAAIGGDSIYLSADAAGNGWFVDPTPRTIAAVAATMASAPAIPADREDLLTVVLHELGHVLGLGDLDPTVTPDDLMTETLPSGVRRLPSDRDVIAAIELGSVDPVQSQVNGAGLLFAATGDPLHESRNLVAWTDEVANASISRNADKEAAKRRSNTAIDELFSILAES